MARPVLKWAGGKRRLRFEIDKVLPHGHAGRDYHEPFFGGGALQGAAASTMSTRGS